MKLHRERDQRRALLKSLAESLILFESIETTLPKAKAVSRYAEKLINQAKRGQESLSQRRQVIKQLSTLEASHKLVDEISPKLSGRSSGYFRIERTTLRRGDGAQMAKVSFVDQLEKLKKTAKTDQMEASKTADKDDKAEKSTDDLAGKQTTAQPFHDTAAKIAQPTMPNQAPKRAGRRGDR